MAGAGVHVRLLAAVATICLCGQLVCGQSGEFDPSHLSVPGFTLQQPSRLIISSLLIVSVHAKLTEVHIVFHAFVCVNVCCSRVCLCVCVCVV